MKEKLFRLPIHEIIEEMGMAIERMEPNTEEYWRLHHKLTIIHNALIDEVYEIKKWLKVE